MTPDQATLQQIVNGGAVAVPPQTGVQTQFVTPVTAVATPITLNSNTLILIGIGLILLYLIFEGSGR